MELNWIKFPASQINTSIRRRSLNTFSINFISQKGYKKYDYPEQSEKKKKYRHLTLEINIKFHFFEYRKLIFCQRI